MVKHRDKIREFVEYLLDTDDVEVINHYDDMLWEIVEEISREIAVEFATQIDDDYDEETPFEERFQRWGDIFDKWKSNKEDK